MEVRHDSKAQRFVTEVEGGEASLTYTLPDPKTLDLQHTDVPHEAEGKGVGSALVRYACDYARENHLRLVPSCPFADRWIERHDEYGDLVRDE